jgi:hypothetical protein
LFNVLTDELTAGPIKQYATSEFMCTRIVDPVTRKAVVVSAGGAQLAFAEYLDIDQGQTEFLI